MKCFWKWCAAGICLGIFPISANASSFYIVDYGNIYGYTGLKLGDSVDVTSKSTDTGQGDEFYHNLIVTGALKGPSSLFSASNAVGSTSDHSYPYGYHQEFAYSTNTPDSNSYWIENGMQYSLKSFSYDENIYGGPFNDPSYGDMIELDYILSNGVSEQLILSTSLDAVNVGEPIGSGVKTPIAAVPEAKTWATAIVGLGLVGFLLRRCKDLAPMPNGYLEQ